MTTKKKCRFCGSEDLRQEHFYVPAHIPFGKNVSLKNTSTLCDNCGMDWVSDEQNDSKAVIREAKRKMVPAIVKFLNKEGYSDARIQRAFWLAPATVSRWKSVKNNPSDTALALLLLIRKYPALIDASEAGIDTDMSDELLLKSLVNTMHSQYASAANAVVVKNHKKNGKTFTGAFVMSDSCEEIGHGFEYALADDDEQSEVLRLAGKATRVTNDYSSVLGALCS